MANKVRDDEINQTISLALLEKIQSLVEDVVFWVAEYDKLNPGEPLHPGNKSLEQPN